MPVTYGVLRGKVINAIPYNHGTDHYNIEIQDANNAIYRIAVDVYSGLKGQKRKYSTFDSNVLDTDREVMYYKDENYTHKIIDLMPGLGQGLTSNDNIGAGLKLDFIRYNPVLFPLGQMKVVPPKDAAGNVPDLNRDIDPWIQKAKNNDDAEVFAFGSSWNDHDPDAKPDPTQYFNPNPYLGIHDIHMNQGDTGNEARYNGIWQDGALFVHFITVNQWVAMFFRFQDQSLDTDDNGDPNNSK
jgi:uncharacterized protein YukJ